MPVSTLFIMPVLSMMAANSRLSTALREASPSRGDKRGKELSLSPKLQQRVVSTQCDSSLVPPLHHRRYPIRRRILSVFSGDTPLRVVQCTVRDRLTWSSPGAISRGCHIFAQCSFIGLFSSCGTICSLIIIIIFLLVLGTANRIAWMLNRAAGQTRGGTQGWRD